MKIKQKVSLLTNNPPHPMQINTFHLRTLDYVDIRLW